MDKLPLEHVSVSNAGRIVGVVGVFHFIAVAFVCLRLYARVIILGVFRAEDALICIVTALALTAWICLIVQIPYGLGRHFQTIPAECRIKFEQITFWKTIISDDIAMGLLRIATAIGLLRLDNDLKWYRWSIYGIIGFVIAYSIQAIVWLFLYCTPFSGWWQFQWMNPFDHRCRDFNSFPDLTYWNISCSIFTDACLGALPVPIIWNLKINFRVRLYIICVLNLGYLSIIMGIIKAVYIHTTGGNPDNIFNYWVHFWQNLQLNMGIIAACASFLKPIFGRILKLDGSAACYNNYANYRTSDRTSHDAEACRSKTRRDGKSTSLSAGEKMTSSKCIPITATV
ncbi:hypothetical protein LZ31DRAFT_604765 [Colletotrichum somersetense]|nr:hypothetical protein LZ31DRAFT_604765 [Colletotrichum somersetense]